jgi:hypothetical protein
MADQPRTHSGSRWEPAPGSAPTGQEPPPDEARTSESVTDSTARVEATPYEVAHDDAAARDRRPRLRTRAALAGAATALALGGGLAGFAVGHGGGGDDGFRPADFSQPGAPSFGGHDDRDGSDGGGRPSQQFGGSSGGSSSPSDPGTDSGTDSAADPA